MRPLALALAVLSINAMPAQMVSPFGLTFGATKAELDKTVGQLTQAQGAGQWTATKVPQPHPDFETYVLVISPTHGLCKIGAITKPIEMNSFGTQIKDAFNKLAEQLDAKYGPSQTLDSLKVGSIWDEPNDWSMALFQQERQLTKMWLKPKGATNLEALALQAKAPARSTGYLVLSYEAQSFAACQAELNAASRSVL